MNYNTFILVLPWLISYCLCEITENTKVKLLADFINYYNLQPNHDHQASDAYLQSVREIDFTTYRIELSFGFNKNGKRARMKCSAMVKDIGEKGIALVNNDVYCSEVQLVPNAEDVSVESVEDQARKPVKLENEVQSDTGLTSGEQFIAIPRDQPSAPCIGCSSHVNPQAAGVKDLADLGIRHLNLHEPTVKHSLDSVIDVERQVQVVNGVRYNLILSINFNNCSEVNTGTDVCSSTKTCKISILVKPWQTLPSGSKYRSIVANNCTEEWLFGDNGEVLPEFTDNSDHKERDDNTSSDVDDIKVEHHEDSQSQPNQGRTLTIEEIKALEEQILPHDSADHYSNGNKNIENLSPGSAEISKEHVVKAETNQQFTNNNVDVTDSSKKETADISQDKKKVIDEMLDFLNFSGFKARPQQPTEEMIPRVKRSYDYDLQILSITEKFRDLKKSIENAKYIYEMAQAMVDYLNEIDMAIKNRAVKNVLKAEEEEENDKRFVYIQAQVVIPCDTVNCDAKKTQSKICNGVIDSTNKNNPQILNTFCHVDTKEMEMQENVKEVSSDDPVLLRLTKEVLRKIESESTDSHAIKIKKIVAANTRVVSGRVTKISMVIERINCNKSVPLALRTNCSTLQNLGSNICEVIVHEKHWLKEKKITYSCTERPIDMTISKHKQDDKSDDPKIVELLEEALHYLEVESDKKYKQKIVKVSNITTQIIAGFLINIEFVVGYTNCTHAEDFKAESGKCELLTTERLRRCKAQVWDRLWIVDGRQMEVTCDENTNKRKELDIIRKKRSLDFVAGDIVQNVDNPEYQKLAEESLQNYLKTSSSQQHYEIIKIERVTVQVVSGKKTKIKFIISPTDCNITSDGSASLSQCKLVNTDNMINCNSTILEQPWINNKQYSVQCNMDSNEPQSTSEIRGLEKQIYGGIKNQDQGDSKFQILAEESLQKYIQISGSYQHFKVVKIEEVTTQIVQGLLTRIEFIATDGKGTQITCYSKVWEQERLNKKDIDVSCQNDNQRVKRQVVGGPTKADLNNPKYVQLANESLQKYLLSTGNAKNHEVVRINKARTQVVSGSLTKIDFDVKETGKSNDDTINCHSEIWERPWLDKKDITVSCQSGNQRVKRQLAGGPTEAEPNNPKYVQLANESLQKYLFSTGNAKKHEVVRINKVTTQVVSGSLTKIDFDVKETGKSNDDTINCHSEIWERPWLDKKDITVSCQSGNERVIRQLAGGPAEADPKNPKYAQLANESLQKYLFSTGNAKKHEVVRINKVTTQVVSGSLTKIDFDVKETGKSNDDTINCHSEIWERPWLDKKDITVSCQSGNQRVKRQLAGGPTEAEPNNPKYVQLANESLQKYLFSTGNAKKHEVVRINKVTTQVVSGSLTKIDFIVKETGKSNDDTINCHSEIWERPWLDKKDITVSCQSGNQRVKRQLAGGPTEAEPNNPKYVQLANESLQKYLFSTGNAKKHEVVRINKVTTQVVSGSLTKIDFDVKETGKSNDDTINCHSEIWERPWLDKKNITVSCQSGNERVKRQLAGGPAEADPKNPKYAQLANESLQKYLFSTGNAKKHEVVRINKVTTQVVSGSLTKIDFDVKETGKSNDDTINCHSEIWERPWLDKKDITVSCQSGNQRVKRQLAGGPTEAEPNNPKYVQLANESLQKYLFSTGNAKKHEVVRINKVTTQVVSGSLTKIDFIVKETGKSNDDTINCHSEIWERPWLDKKDITVSCQSGNERVKRQLAGGPTEADPKNPKYAQLANESLQKYLFSTGNAKKHEVVRINKVNTQVVSGSLTKIDFDVKETGKSNDDTINCHSEIWERPWLDKKDITVSCQSVNQKEERQLIGAPTKQDPTDLKYIQLAGDSLQKYLILTSNPRPHKVVRIESVTTQLVSGLLTRIDFVATESDIPSGEIITCFSKIWEQEWQNRKDIDVSCQGTQRKYKRNDLSEKNPNDPKYLQLADESLKQYLSNTGNEQPYKVVRVKKVNVQLISGLLTRLNFVALPTDTTRSDVMNCYSEVLEQPWNDKKDIKVSCQYDNYGLKKEISGRIIKRDPNAAKYLKLAEESFKKYLSDTGNQQPYKVVRIDQVTTQISVGYLTRINFVVTSNSTNAIMNCFSEIWEQADKTKLNVECENDLGFRQKRNLKQGKIKNRNYEAEQDGTKPQFQLLAAQALRKYSQRKGILHKIVGIKRVTMRVVSGIIYKIDFIASPTECLFNVSNVREHSCKLIANTILYCHTEIWDQPWIRKKKIDIGCNNPVENDYGDYTVDESEETGNRKKLTTESKHATKLENEKVYALAEEALEDFLSSSNRKYVFRITEIHSFNEYMADSVTSKLEFSIAPTLCLRDAFFDMSHSCEFKKPLTEYYCKAKIVEQSWLESEKDIKVHCKKQNNKTESVKRTKRQIGRNMEEDDNEVDEETAYYYAERAVHQLNERSDTYNLYKLITIHAVRSTTQMKAIVVKMFIEVAETYCLRQNRNFNTIECEEMEGLNHRICLARIYPSTDDELVVKHVAITCDDDDNEFDSATGLYIPELLRLSIAELEKDPQRPFKLVHQGEPQVIPSLDTKTPVILNFVIGITNCSVNVDLTTNPFQCFLDSTIPSKSCTSKIWLDVESSTIRNIDASCNPYGRKKRAILDTVNITADDSELNKFMKATIEKLEMSSMHRYKQRVLHINSYSSKITSGRVTTIDFDVAYTSCLKYEWVANITSCDFLEHLPRRHCVAQIWERLWINNGMNIDVSCEDDETPLEAHVEFESAEMANQLAQESLKHIEAKYPNLKKQKVVRIFSLEKQVVAGVHYRMKMEVGTTDCVALSDQTDCKLNTVTAVNKFCRVNVWVRPWTDHPPNFRVTCDYQEGATMDLYRQIQAEHLFINFVATYNPSYVNDHHEMAKRFEIFKANVRKIHEFNVFEKGTAKYGVTRFADLTYKEFSSRYMGLKPSLRKNNQPPVQKADIPSIKMPLNFDWREYNAVTDVKDQGDCGVSWAFSVTGNIESQWKIKSEKLLTLSEQQLLDCDKVDEGCSGGLPEIAYREIEEMGGMQSDLEYPYEGGGETCLFNKTRAKVRISGAVNITSNETGMAQWLVYNGPISIGMNGQAMQFYMRGIAHPWQSFCNETKLDHAALIVGYGEYEYPVFHKKIRYWIVKNSWGETWGEKGYYRIQRGGGTCGVNRMATSAVIAN